MSLFRVFTLARSTALGIAAALALSGCATGFRADVSRFQQLPAPTGQTFTVQAGDVALAQSIEFQTYAQLVSNALTAQGYRAATAPGSAELIVSMDYGVDAGREKLVEDFDPFFSGYGFGPYHGWYGNRGVYGHRGFYGRRFVYGFHDPFLFGGGFGRSGIRSYTVYTGGLDLTIDRAADNRRLFEGRAEAMARSNRLTYLVPNLIDAMFTGFPGNSGETVKITVAPEKG